MFGSAIVYIGLVVAGVGLLLLIKPVASLRIRTRRRALMVVCAGLLLVVTGFLLPAAESRVTRTETRLDEFMPTWQFGERHSTEVDAPPARVFEALEQVRADEIRLFRTLTWIRRGGRALPEGILHAGSNRPLIDIAVDGGFLRLAEDAPRELVIGTVVAAPPRAEWPLSAQVFQQKLPPGFAVAAMNFRVTEIGPGRSLVSTETRVYANSPGARRRFAVYWRLIYPGSALIRRMWLRAVERRAEAA